MSYLEIIERLKTDLPGAAVTLSVSEPGNETNEKNEISHRGVLTPAIKTSLEMDPRETVGASAELPPLGRRNARGDFVLTIEDMPELENRLRLQGWKVKRHGNELICTSRGGLRIQ